MNYKYNNNKKKIAGLVLIFGLMHAFNALSDVAILNSLSNNLTLSSSDCSITYHMLISKSSSVIPGEYAILNFNSASSCLLTMKGGSGSEIYTTNVIVKSAEAAKDIIDDINKTPDAGTNLYSIGYMALSKSSAANNNIIEINIKQASVDIKNDGSAEPVTESSSDTDVVKHKSSMYVGTASKDDCEITLPKGETWPLKPGDDYILRIHHLNLDGQCNAKITYGAATSTSTANQYSSTDDVTFDLDNNKTTLKSTNTSLRLHNYRIYK